MSIEEKFTAAVDIIHGLPQNGTFQPSEDLMLKLHAYYMQATEGPCNIAKPSLWCYSSRIKWNAWNDLGPMQREIAMEKYVEELTKVIETMSYNENVSKFMSLIGPFYEVVATEEFDFQSDKKINNKSLAEYPFPVKMLEDLQTLKSESSHTNSLIQNSSINDDIVSCSIDSPCKRPLEAFNFDPYSDSTSTCVTQRNVANIFKTKTRHKNQPFTSQHDMLILTMINLQNSLEEMVKKLEKLQNLAKSADLNYKRENNSQRSDVWTIGASGTALALLWPIVIHLCTRSF